MDPALGSKEQMVAAAAAAAVAASGQRAQKFTAEDLLSLRDRVGKSVVQLKRTTMNTITQGTIIASTPTFCYVLVHKACVGTCEMVFPMDGARFKLNEDDFIINSSNLAVAKVSHGSTVPVRFTERPVSFVDSVYLYVREGQGLTPGSVVNPTGESKPSYFPGNFLIDNAPDFGSQFGAPVFDEAGEFLGIVISRETTCFVVSACKIKEILRQKLPTVAVDELTSLKVL